MLVVRTLQPVLLDVAGCVGSWDVGLVWILVIGVLGVLRAVSGVRLVRCPARFATSCVFAMSCDRFPISEHASLSV